MYWWCQSGQFILAGMAGVVPATVSDSWHEGVRGTGEIALCLPFQFGYVLLTLFGQTSSFVVLHMATLFVHVTWLAGMGYIPITVL